MMHKEEEEDWGDVPLRIMLLALNLKGTEEETDVADMA